MNHKKGTTMKPMGRGLGAHDSKKPAAGFSPGAKPGTTERT